MALCTFRQPVPIRGGKGTDVGGDGTNVHTGEQLVRQCEGKDLETEEFEGRDSKGDGC